MYNKCSDANPSVITNTNLLGCRTECTMAPAVCWHRACALAGSPYRCRVTAAATGAPHFILQHVAAAPPWARHRAPFARRDRWLHRSGVRAVARITEFVHTHPERAPVHFESDEDY
jgi:hypothetical protein